MTEAQEIALELHKLIEVGKTSGITKDMLDHAAEALARFDRAEDRAARALSRRADEVDRMVHATACSCCGCLALRARRVELDREAADRLKP